MNFQIHESVTKYMFLYHCTLDTIKMCKVYLLTGPNKSAAHIYVPALLFQLELDFTCMFSHSCKPHFKTVLDLVTKI